MGGEEIFNESELNKEFTVPLKIQCLRIEIPSPKTASCNRKNDGTKLMNFFRSCCCRKISPFSPMAVRCFPANFVKKMNLMRLTDLCKDWIKHPMNIALLTWSVCVASSSSMQALLLLGMLNREFPAKSSQTRWIEINNQVLNALFTLMSLYQHPNLLHHLVLLCRWRSEDRVELRKIYCKNKAQKPNEKAHMAAILLLLHITCFSQYILCGLYWGYTIATRPQLLENLFNAIGFIAPVLAAAYAIFSPLAKQDLSVETEQLEMIEERASVTKPDWNGGVFDCGDDVTVSFLSFFCFFCVFGWNMERIGFGNMYVHTAMFFLLCSAPVLIFGVSALNISNVWVRNVVGVSGMVLSACGLMYGGFWRSKMRERLKLLGNGVCCGSETASDYVQWLCCCWCALAQEVRTGSSWEVEDGGFCRGGLGGEDEGRILICPLPRESRASSDAGGWKSVNDAKMAPLQQLIEVV